MAALIFSSAVRPYGFVEAAKNDRCNSSTSGNRVTEKCCHTNVNLGQNTITNTCVTCRWTAGNKADFEICDDPVTTVLSDQNPSPSQPGNANVPPNGHGGIVEPGPKTPKNNDANPTNNNAGNAPSDDGSTSGTSPLTAPPSGSNNDNNNKQPQLNKNTDGKNDNIGNQKG
jgi:hypothetical protein